MIAILNNNMINTVIQGDCLEVMKDIPDKSIDMILCDLPYGTTACKWDTVIPFEPLWEQYKRIIKNNGAIVLTASQPFTSALVMSNTKMFKYEWIWEKERASNFFTANKTPMKYHENICVFYKSQPTYNPQFILGRPNHSAGKDGIGKSKSEHYGFNMFKDRENSQMKYPSSIIKVNKDKPGFHPTQKPVALFEYLIKTYTNEGDLVLDNCAGSGTTGIACINTNRNYILIEKEQEYIDIINKRINEQNLS